MTAELFTARNNRKFIPILRHTSWEEAAPSWLRGKYYIDLSDAGRFEAGYQDLLSTLHGRRLQAPPVGRPPKLSKPVRQAEPARGPEPEPPDPAAPIKITGIVT